MRWSILKITFSKRLGALGAIAINLAFPHISSSPSSLIKDERVRK